MFARVGVKPKSRASPIALILATLIISGCEQEARDVAPQIRPVRAITIEKREAGSTVTLAGRIEAEDEVALGFRIAGRLQQTFGSRGDRVPSGKLIARLESQNEQNALRRAQADLAAARAQFTQARNAYQRQNTLLKQGWTTRASYDEAAAAQQTAQSQVKAAEAHVSTAKDNVGFTELRTDAPGVLTEIGPSSGEVVQAGQMIVRVARKAGRDAVFDLSAQMARSLPNGTEVTVYLTNDRDVTAKGRVREVSPQADPVTRTFEVKIGLADPPPEMRLGATVTGRIVMQGETVIEVPAAALTRSNERPAVWIVDPKANTVSLRYVVVQRFDETTVVVSEGLNDDDVVVVAGVQALHPGQKVRLLGKAP
jgi:RND family efflux transporter MFP subunit